MAEEYYRKTSSLFEDFKKKELYLMSLEKKYDYKMSFDKDIKEPLQSHWSKINESQRKSEMTYNALMKNISSLDRCTEQMSLKMEKLRVLRNIILKSPNSSFQVPSDTYTREFQSSLPSISDIHFLSTVQPAFSNYESPILTNTLRDIPSNSLSPYVPGKNFPEFNFRKLSETNSLSTQTENLVCPKCHSSFYQKPEHNIQTTLFSSANQYGDSPSSDLHRAPANIAFDTEIKLDEKPDTSVATANIKRSIIFENPNNITNMEKSIETQQGLEVLDNETSRVSGNQTNKICDDPANIMRNSYRITEHLANTSTIALTKEIINENDQINVKNINRDLGIRNEECTTRNSTDFDEDNTTASIVSENKTASKSDDESINHEFDFLENDTDLNKKENVQPKIKISSEGKAAADYPKLHSQGPKSELLNVVDEKLMQKRSDLLNAEPLSDSSVSGAPTASLNSEKETMASESDSSLKEDVPLSASAAYQALLGNTAALRSIQQKKSSSDSDSEAEIERAVAANVTKKANHSSSEMSVPKQKTGDCVPENKSISSQKRSSIAIGNKPQNKLSKSTRKILGYQSSSSSEADVAPKRTVQKKEEDDEFDFFD